MSSECCVQKAAMKVGKIIVKGQEVGIGHLPSILEEAHRSGLEGSALKQELVRLTAIYNYIPLEVRDDYGEALMGALQSYRNQLSITVRVDVASDAEDSTDE